MSIFRYLRLKVVATILRLLVRVASGSPKATPDDVLYIPSRDTGRKLKLNVYKPRRDTKPTPVLLNLHGSGFTLPAHGSDDEFCRRVARDTEYTVLDLRYRLAPENPFPAALHDIEDAVHFILEQRDQYDLARFAISGFSAGGNLALATAGVVFPKDTFRSILTFYPSTNKSVDPADRKTPDPSGQGMPVALSSLFDTFYIPPEVDRKNPLVSPSFAPVDAFPRDVLFVTAAQDNLCFEAEELAARIEAANGERHVVVQRMEKCVHAWDKKTSPGSIQEKAKDDAYSLAVEMLQR